MSTLRWRIRGRLVTGGHLHVGSGETTIRDGLVDENTHQAAQVSAVAVDANGRPYVPGSTLKGVLRAWAARHAEPKLVERVFGSEELGGGMAFADAPLLGHPKPQNPPPYWNADRCTGVVPRVALDRRFGTASHRRLFHLEVVPADAELEVEAGGDGLTEDEVALVLAALQAFDDGRLALGAHTGDGWGRMTWHLDEIRRLGRDDVVAWIDAGASEMVMDAAPALPGPEREDLLRRAGKLVAEKPASSRLAVKLELAFTSPFLVRDTDPDRAGKGVGRPDAVARRDHAGKPHLPASSFRGALRSRAEKILRTLGGDGAACGVDAPRDLCESVESQADVGRLCPACRVFGAAGWRAPLVVKDFTSSGDLNPHLQDFVAVDRFTGGAAAEKKFNVEAYLAPRLTGRLELDLAALGYAGCGPWALALLVLSLRDVAEGDVTFGAGAAHGYGACLGRVTALTTPPWEAIPEKLRTDLGLSAEDVAGDLAWPAPGSTLGRALKDWTEELEAEAQKADKAWRQDQPREEGMP